MSSRLTDRDLHVPFVDKEKLVESKAPFYILEYEERQTSYEGKPREESVFTIAMIQGPERGYDQLLTMGKTAARVRFGKTVASRAPLGPATLVRVTKNKEGKKLANPRYEFRPVTDSKIIAEMDEVIRKVRTGAIDRMNEDAEGDADGQESDDLPF